MPDPASVSCLLQYFEKETDGRGVDQKGSIELMPSTGVSWDVIAWLVGGLVDGSVGQSVRRSVTAVFETFWGAWFPRISHVVLSPSFVIPLAPRAARRVVLTAGQACMQRHCAVTVL